RWRGVLEPLQSLQLSWSGRGELRTLTAAETGSQRQLAGDVLYAGLYAAELILRTTARDDPHPGLFACCERLLTSLVQAPTPGPALRLFERDLLAEIGYALPLTATSDTGRPVRAGADYLYHPQAGLREAGGRPAAGEI